MYTFQFQNAISDQFLLFLRKFGRLQKRFAFKGKHIEPLVQPKRLTSIEPKPKNKRYQNEKKKT